MLGWPKRSLSAARSTKMAKSCSPTRPFFCFVFHHVSPKLFFFIHVSMFISQSQQAQELKNIPGADAVRSIDSMALEVLVRQGTKIKIHPDQCRLWPAKGPEYEKEFQQILQDHAEKYEGLLATCIQQQSSSGSTGQGQSQVVAVEEEPEPEASRPDPAPAIEPMSKFDTYDALHAADPVTVKCASEIPQVELIKTASKKVFLMSACQKAIPKYAILGGFGTGKHPGLMLR